MTIKSKKILVITSCSAKKNKISKPIKAINLYNGNLFNFVKKFARIHDFDLRIISAKYGLIHSEEKINFYDKKIENSKDIQHLQKIVIPKLKTIIKNYKRILIIMGDDYKKIINPVRSEKFVYSFDKRGLGGYLSLMSKLLTLEEKILHKLILKNKTISIEIIEKSYKFQTL